MDVARHLTQFLRTHCHPARPLLLALSGGADSLCLFHALLKCQKELQITFHVAHLDHGWRPESIHEAECLKNLAHSHGIPYHSKRLDSSAIQGNAEAYCREQRLLYFKALCQSHGLAGVLLGHHGDDQAETVLKRLLEGASLGRLSGLQPVSAYQGLTLLRPFLALSKQEICHWLEARGIVPFEDSTNSDNKFLRARMRTTIIPWLSEVFGKEIRDPLRCLGAEALEWREYLDSKMQPYLKQIVQGPMGMYLDLGNQLPACMLELKVLIRYFCENSGLSPSRHIVDTAAGILSSGVANKWFPLAPYNLIVDRHRLFLVPAKPDFEWKMTIAPVASGERATATGWNDAWQGSAHVVLPLGDYNIEVPMVKKPYGASSLDRWWTAHRVPAFLRQQLPIVCDSGRIRHEFLTGRQLNKADGGESVIITIKLVHS